MQKKIIALAVAGLVSGVAYAQTNVTVYGVIDQNYTYSSTDNGRVTGGDYKFSGLRDGTSTGLNGSRFGFFGEEALGNGLSAIFRMEYGREQDENGAQTLAIRQSFVGLKNQYGTITAGRHYNAASDIYGGFSSNGVVSVMPLNTIQGQGSMQIRSQGGNARQDNLVKYTSPNWSGFTLGASYAYGESPRTINTATYNKEADTTDNGRFTLAGKYENGPFAVGAAYGLVSNVRSNVLAQSALEGDDISEWYVGGSYDFKVVKLYATYQTYKDKNEGAAVLTDQKLWSLGASIPVGAKGTVMVEYAKVSYDQDNAAPGAALDGNSKGFGIGYKYDLSKRTALYTFVSQIKHSDDAFAAPSAVTGTAAIGEKQSNFVVGVRHMF